MPDLVFTTDTKVLVGSDSTLVLPANPAATFRRITRESKISGPNIRIAFDTPKAWEACQNFLLDWEDRSGSSGQGGAPIFRGDVYMRHDAIGQFVAVYVQEAT